MNMSGQRYIGNGLEKKIFIDIYGVPGQDVAAFMNGPVITIHNNAQDGVGNTMDDGLVVVKGMAGDVLGYAMRGGKIYIRDDVGYRVGIHMKAYQEKIPVIIVGGKAGDFFGEYMAGGILVLLGMKGDTDRPITGNFLGTGMHGGVIYIRGSVSQHQLGKGLAPKPLAQEDEKVLRPHITEFCELTEIDPKEVFSKEFCKVVPYTHRPYGNLYAH
jgi:glutamate synthase domain-containing protein 3